MRDRNGSGNRTEMSARCHAWFGEYLHVSRNSRRHFRDFSVCAGVTARPTIPCRRSAGELELLPEPRMTRASVPTSGQHRDGRLANSSEWVACINECQLNVSSRAFLHSGEMGILCVFFRVNLCPTRQVNSSI